jgi:hypothetical protein
MKTFHSHGTLKGIADLSEEGISPTDVRQSRRGLKLQEIVLD